MEVFNVLAGDEISRRVKAAEGPASYRGQARERFSEICEAKLQYAEFMERWKEVMRDERRRKHRVRHGNPA